MRDRFFYPLALLAALAMVALAMVWPQGMGTPSPGAFGHPMAPPPAPQPAKNAAAKAAAKGALKPPAGESEPKLRPPIESDRPEAATP
jgi:hypothetical protein